MRSLSEISEMRIRRSGREVLPDALRQVERDAGYRDRRIMHSVAKAMAVPAAAIAVALSPGIARADSPIGSADNPYDAQHGFVEKGYYTDFSQPNMAGVPNSTDVVYLVAPGTQGTAPSQSSTQASQAQPPTQATTQSQPSTSAAPQNNDSVQSATSPAQQTQSPSPVPAVQISPTNTMDSPYQVSDGQWHGPGYYEFMSDGKVVLANSVAELAKAALVYEGSPYPFWNGTPSDDVPPLVKTFGQQPQQSPQQPQPAPAVQLPASQASASTAATSQQPAQAPSGQAPQPAVPATTTSQVSAPAIDSYEVKVSGGCNIYGHGELWDISTDSLQIFWTNIETTGSGMQIYMAKSAFSSGNLKGIDSSVIPDINSSSFTLFDTSGYGLAQTNGPNIMYSAQDISKGLGISNSDWGTTYKTIFVAIVDPTALARTQYFAVPLHAMVQKSTVTPNTAGSVTNAGSTTVVQQHSASSSSSETTASAVKVNGQATMQKSGSGQDTTAVQQNISQGTTTTTSTTTRVGAQQATTTTVNKDTSDSAQDVNITQVVSSVQSNGGKVGTAGEIIQKVGQATDSDITTAIGDAASKASTAISIATRDTSGIVTSAVDIALGVEGIDTSLLGVFIQDLEAMYNIQPTNSTVYGAGSKKNQSDNKVEFSAVKRHG